MQIAGSAFLVTGGSSGLGAASIREIVAGGGHAIIADLNERDGRALEAELGPAVRFVATDVTDEASVQGAVEAALDAFGSLRGAVNCAGVVLAQRLLTKNGPHDLGAFARVIEVNLIGTFNVARLAAEAISRCEPLADDERGVIVNTSSVAAMEGQIGQAAYAASKGGVASMTLPLARELARYGIRVAAIAPGLFDTPMMAGLPDEARQSLGAQTPFPHRLGHPSEFAALVRHIIENPMVNGVTIRLDGAIRMAPK